MPHLGLEPVSVLRLAFQSDALPTNLPPLMSVVSCTVVCVGMGGNISDITHTGSELFVVCGRNGQCDVSLMAFACGRNGQCDISVMTVVCGRNGQCDINVLTICAGMDSVISVL